MAEFRDARWLQRLQNFGTALSLLNEALEHGPSSLSALEKEGVIHRFEYTLELAWKTAKDYLEAQGLVITPETPRQVVKEAFAARIVADGQVWIQMLDHRNLLSHKYDQLVFAQAVDAIGVHYLPAINELFLYLQKQGKA